MRVIVSFLISAWLALGLSAGTLVRFHLPVGDMTFELLDDIAPLTTSNFLAQLKAGTYSNSIIDEILPASGEYFARAGALAITNRGQTNADFAKLVALSGPPSESLLPDAYPNASGTLSMAIAGASAVLTNNTLVLATQSDPLRFVFNLGNNSQLNTYAVKIGTNGVNLEVQPANTNQYDTVATNCVYVTNCISATNCIVTTNCTYTTNRWQRVANYTPFGLLRIGNATFNQLRTFTTYRQPETNIVIPQLTLPPPVDATLNYFPVVYLDQAAIDQGLFDFTQVLSLDMSVAPHPQLHSTITTNGNVSLTWDNWTNLTKVLILTTTNLAPVTVGASQQIQWQLFTTVTNPVIGTTNIVFQPNQKRQFFQVIFE